MLHRLFLLLFECGLSHDASHVVWAVVKYPSPSPQLHHRGQTASLQRVPRDQRCLQLAKISLPVFFMLLRLCWAKFHLNQTLHIDECCSEPLHIVVFRGRVLSAFQPRCPATRRRARAAPFPRVSCTSKTGPSSQTVTVRPLEGHSSPPHLGVRLCFMPVQLV